MSSSPRSIRAPRPVARRVDGRRTRPGRWIGALAAGLVVLAAVVVDGRPAGARDDPATSPLTTVSADGRTGTDGTRTLAVSQAADLDPVGAVVSVAGSGYDVGKGIYVALCVVPPTNHVPSPCGGGVDTEGTQGASQWISSNPPGYGVGLAQPYQPGGAFQTSFTVRSEIIPGIDCRQVRCAIVTRNDHTRTSDRSQDIVVPVSFRVAAPPTTVPPAGPGPVVTEPPTTVAPAPGPVTSAPIVTVPPLANPTTTVPAPAATVAADGRSVTDGTRTLAVTRAADLDPAGQTITVRGTAFDPRRGIYVGLCAVPAGGAAPSPCRTGSPAANRWVSSDPPEYGVGLATPFAADGSFEVELTVEPVLDTTTDCRTAACAIVARADDTAGGDDRGLDLALPVTFAAAPTGTTAPTTTAAVGPAPDATEAASSVTVDDRSSAGPLVAAGTLVVALALIAGAIAVGRRRTRSSSDPSPSDPSPPDGATP